MTNEQLAEIEARATKATTGPWKWDGMWSAILHFGPFQGGRAGGAVCSCADDSRRNSDGSYQSSPRPHDREFIAHSRQDIPALIAYIRKLEAERLTPEERETILGALDGEIGEEAKLALQFGPKTDSRKKHDARVEAAMTVRAKIEAARDGGEG